MPQIFPPIANVIARVVLFGGILLVAGAAWGAYELYRSPYVTGQYMTPDQPVPFSHKHHVKALGLDCRYCHVGVETSAVAGMPPTETCMTCHSQLYTEASMLAPVRASLVTGTPIAWNRVNKLPDYVYFNHAIHVKKGVSCVSCHGQVNEMPLTQKAEAFHMSFCLECHRNPGPNLRPTDQVFNMDYQVPANQDALGASLAKQYHLHSPELLTSCSTCHR
jgi:hypothetical protein